MKIRDLIFRKTRYGDFLTFSNESAVAYAEVHLAGTAQEEVDGYVQKEILRTGEWPVIPTRGGIVRQGLKIVRNGKSDREAGVISLEELVENFKKVGQRVQIPLTDTDDDHKNALRVNTGFVTDIWIEDRAEGDARLVAKMQFTEADVKDKVLRGTYADVSCGIPWEFSTRGERYGAVLEHVAITNRPFIDDLGPFLALSDKDGKVEREIVHFNVADDPAAVPPPAPAPPEPVEPPQRVVVDPFGGLSIKQVMEQAGSVLPEPMRETFKVIDVKANGIVVQNDDAKMSWRIPFKVEEGKLVSSNEGWSFLEYNGEATALLEPAAPAPPPPPVEPARPESSGDPVDGELEAARQLRNARLGVAASSQPMKEGNMPLSREELEALNLSDMPESQRAAIQKLLEDNSTLAASSREGEANKRITELEELGLKNYPGALKLYRTVMLSDDGGPAVVVLSDDGKTKEPKTALSILDDFIEAIKGAEGKVHLSDQAALVPDDPKPPLTPEGEKKPLSERVDSAKQALAGVHGA